MTIKEMETTARELRELARLREELDAEITALQDALKLALGDQEQVTAGEYKISYKAVTNQRVDAKALKAALPEIATQFTKTTTAKRFTVN